MFVVPFALSFGFVRSSFSVVQLGFMAARPEPPREKGWTDAGVERKTRHCLTKLRGIKFAFYCAWFLNASFYRGRGKLPSAIATIVRGGNSPISFRDMNTTSPFDPLVGSHGESISRIEIHTRVWSFDQLPIPIYCQNLKYVMNIDFLNLNLNLI